MKKVMVALITACGLLVLGAGCGEKKAATEDKDKIGVQECDDYITKYTACIAKMPAVAKTSAETGFKNQKDAWRAAAATPQGREGLKPGCRMALESLVQNPLCK
ncbi:Hypothetical protein A7982_08319 [Minicystis rosea]|nr:Hypothetical protein A7982_08319 [Minicystis rosea]